MNVEIYLTSPLNDELKLNGKINALNKASIERLLLKNKTAINKWLLFGRAEIGITDADNGNIVAEGFWNYNAFSGQGDYEVWLNE